MKRADGFEAIQDRYWSQAKFRSPDDPVVAAYAEPKVAFLDRHLSLAGKTVLDAGCGNGIFTQRLARVARSVVGLDLSAHMLGCNPHPVRVQGSALALPFAERAFDVVFEANLLHHLPDPAPALRELARCSARYLALIEPNRWNPLMFAFGLLVKAERGTLRSSRRGLLRLVENIGFRPRAVTVTGMISQNNTPRFLLPWLKRFDREMFWGEYVVICAERP